MELTELSIDEIRSRIRILKKIRANAEDYFGNPKAVKSLCNQMIKQLQRGN